MHMIGEEWAAVKRFDALGVAQPHALTSSIRCAGEGSTCSSLNLVRLNPGCGTHNEIDGIFARH